MVFRLGVKNGKIADNPARLMDHRKENNQRVRWLTAEEEAMLRAVLRKDEYTERVPDLEIALHTRMRLSEQYGLDWSHVDLEHRVVRILRTKHGEAGHVRLNPVAMTLFNVLLKASGNVKKGLVFKWGCETDRRRHEWFNAALKAAGIEDFHWHDLRHTFASRLVMDGVPLRVVQEEMGHRTIQMTCRYAHLAPSVEHEAVDNMAASWQAKVANAEKQAEERKEAAADKLEPQQSAITGEQNRPTDTKTDTRGGPTGCCGGGVIHASLS